MRNTSVNNNNYSIPQKQQSFGAIKGKNFDATLAGFIRIFYNDSDKLTRLAAEQAELAKTGRDFNSLFDRLVITNSKGEEIHPVIDLQDRLDLSTSCPFSVNATVGNASIELEFYKYHADGGGFCHFCFEHLYRCIESTVKKTAEAMAEPLKNVQFLLGIKPPPKPLAEAALPEFAELSGIPEEQVKLLLPELIEKLTRPGRPATEKELLEIAQEVGCTPLSLSAEENLRILDEVERLSPSIDDEELLEILRLKRGLDKVA